MSNKAKCVISVVVIFLCLAVIALTASTAWRIVSSDGKETQAVEDASPEQEPTLEQEQEPVPEQEGDIQDPPTAATILPPPVSALSFSRAASDRIALRWPDGSDGAVSVYAVMRKSVSGSDSNWVKVGEVPSDGVSTGSDNVFEDRLESTSPQQYLYRIDAVSVDPAGSTQEGLAIPASNILVCLDPGHYKNSSTLQGENLYGYGEGIFTLRLGLALRDVLENTYGIQCRMTRETDVITLSGYTNGQLDQQHLTLRGEYAQGCDLFLSLHTNANQDNVNGYPTCSQPIGITKTLVFVNQLGAASNTTLRQANAIGTNLSRVNYDMGFAGDPGFETVSRDTIHGWSDAYNDALDTKGSVCARLNEKGGDYYGVLRGANAVGVPGMIVEHAHHTVAEMRKAAMEGDLASRWAKADAAGIAEGYGFSPVY